LLFRCPKAIASTQTRTFVKESLFTHVPVGVGAGVVPSRWLTRIALIHPHPHLPAPSLAMAGFQFLTRANTVLLQDYQIQLQLRTVELYCGLRENFIS